MSKAHISSHFSGCIRLVIALVIGAWPLLSMHAQEELRKALYELPDVIFESIDAPEGFVSAWELRIKQPIDHWHPEKGFFYQRVFLSHRDFSKPMVIATEGYQRPQNRIYELTELLQANQLDVEHRYFGASVPDSIDWQYLTLEQVSADLHRIRTIFGLLYRNHWLSTGISKGGQTTIFYRYFYPDDVSVSVPYVAPLNLSIEDERIYTFLDTVGTEACRRKILDFQKEVLKRRTEMLPRLWWWAKGAEQTFTYLTFEQAFEYAVLEYSFSFWQWGHDCDDIPPADAPTDSLVQHLLAVSALDFFADQSMKAYASHYYQAGTQMGYYGYRTEPFKGLLKALPMTPHPTAVFMPDKMPIRFDDSLVKKVHAWLAEHGNRFIYINGDSDTWSATAVRLSPGSKVDAVFFFLPGKDHARARIRSMSEAEKQLLVTTLERWLGIDIE